MTNEYAALAFWICTTILGIMGFVLCVGGLLLPWEGYTTGILTEGNTWAVYGSVIILASLFALSLPKSCSASPALMAAGSVLVILSVLYSFVHAPCQMPPKGISYGIYVSLIGAIITCIGSIFAVLYIKFKPKL